MPIRLCHALRLTEDGSPYPVGQHFSGDQHFVRASGLFLPSPVRAAPVLFGEGIDGFFRVCLRVCRDKAHNKVRGKEQTDFRWRDFHLTCRERYRKLTNTVTFAQ